MIDYELPDSFRDLFEISANGMYPAGASRDCAMIFSGATGVERGSIYDAYKNSRCYSLEDFEGLFRSAMWYLYIEPDLTVTGVGYQWKYVDSLSDYLPCGYRLLRSPDTCGLLRSDSDGKYEFLLSYSSVSLWKYK